MSGLLSGMSPTRDAGAVAAARTGEGNAVCKTALSQGEKRDGRAGNGSPVLSSMT